MAYFPNVALNAATADVDGPVTKLGTVHSKLSMQVILTGAPSGGTVTLQGSLDGVNFDTTTGLAVFTIGTDNSGDMKFSVDTPVMAYRCVLDSLAGGTDPTVSAIVAVGMPS